MINVLNKDFVFHFYLLYSKSMKDWIKRLLSGAAIGVGSAIPGVSGGTIAVILRVYESIVWAVSNLRKEFKRAVIILLPVLVGLVIGVIPTIILMHKALEGFLFGVICIFAGFVAGSLPKITKPIKNEKVKTGYIIALVIAFVLAAGLGVLSVVSKTDYNYLFDVPPWWLYLVMIPVGVLASTALVVPGISGSMILILFGFYTPLIESTVSTAKNCLNGDWSHFGYQVGILGCFAFGVLAGFIIASKLMNYCLNKYRITTYYSILGFVVGSFISLFINYDIWKYYQIWASGNYISIKKEIEIPLGIALFVISLVLSYLLVRYENKREIEEANQSESD